MQWSGQKNGGFTAGEPWIKVNPNYQRINAQNQVGRLIGFQLLSKADPPAEDL